MSNQRIAKNTIATYTRTVFTVALTLFSSRWVLHALGVTDFGLFSVVGSVIIFITFLNTVMAGSAARYFAYSIGQGDFAEVNHWFNAALSIHLCLAFLLILIGWPLGEYAVGHILTVPEDRVTACVWVFRISLVSAFFSMVSVPFIAMFTAKQHISELAAWGILQSTLAFILAWLLRYATGDRLLFYATGMVVILVVIQVTQIFRAMAIFEECSIIFRQWFDQYRLKSIFSFAIWTLIGASGGLLRDQGSAILLNLFFGPSVNAAYGIAGQVSSQTNRLSAAMISAFSPEITASEGRGDRSRMLSLSQRASKIGTILVLLLAIPLMIEIDYVLKLWLIEPPPFAALFCQLILGTFLLDRLSVGYMLAVNAHGKIAAYQATLGTSLLLTLPLGWLFLENGFAPTSIGIAFIITMTIASLGRVFWGRHLFKISVYSWVAGVVWPSIVVAVFATVVGLTIHWLLQPSFLRLFLVITASTTILLLTAWHLALDCKEQEFLRKCTLKVMSRFGSIAS